MSHGQRVIGLVGISETSNKKFTCRVIYRFGLEPDYTTSAAFDVSNYQVVALRNNTFVHDAPKHQFMAPPGVDLQIDWSRFHPKFCNVHPKLIHFKAFRKANNKSRPGNCEIGRHEKYSLLKMFPI